MDDLFMNFHSADSISLSLFCVFSLVMTILIFGSFYRDGATRRQIISFILLVSIASLLAATGVFEQFVFPLLPLFFVALIAFAIRLSFSEYAAKVVSKYSIATLVLFQAFRLPLEFILHHWAESGVIPITMTWNGQNFDVISGVAAVLLAKPAQHSKFWGWVFNIIGSLLLLNVIRVVIFSLPLPISWALENPLQLPFHFPYVLIAPLFVWPAIFGHAVLTRKLLS